MVVVSMPSDMLPGTLGISSLGGDLDEGHPIDLSLLQGGGSIAGASEVSSLSVESAPGLSHLMTGGVLRASMHRVPRSEPPISPPLHTPRDSMDDAVGSAMLPPAKPLEARAPLPPGEPVEPVNIESEVDNSPTIHHNSQEGRNSRAIRASLDDFVVPLDLSMPVSGNLDADDP